MLLFSSLFLTPLLLLLLCFGLGIALCSTVGPNSQPAASTLSIRFFSMSHYFQLVAPLLFLTFLLLTCTRGFSVLIAGGQLAITTACCRWLFCLNSLAPVCLFFFFYSHASTTTRWSSEQYLGVAGLFILWGLAFCASNIFSLFLLFEVANIFIIFVWVYSALSTRAALRFKSNFKQLQGGVSAQLSLVYALLWFIWVAALAAILFFWGLALAQFTIPGLGSAALWLFGSSQLKLNFLAGLLIGLGLALKLMVVPFQSFIALLYEALPTRLLALYQIAYYPFFLGIAVSALLFFGKVFWNLAIGTLLLLSGFSLVWLLAFIKPTKQLHFVLALSAVINLLALLTISVALS